MRFGRSTSVARPRALPLRPLLRLSPSGALRRSVGPGCAQVRVRCRRRRVVVRGNAQRVVVLLLLVVVAVPVSFSPSVLFVERACARPAFSLLAIMRERESRGCAPPPRLDCRASPRGRRTSALHPPRAALLALVCDIDRFNSPSTSLANRSPSLPPLPSRARACAARPKASERCASRPRKRVSSACVSKLTVSPPLFSSHPRRRQGHRLRRASLLSSPSSSPSRAAQLTCSLLSSPLPALTDQLRHAQRHRGLHPPHRSHRSCRR